MKVAISFLFFLLLLLLVCFHSTAAIAVKDMSAQPLARGAEYNLVFISRGGDRVLATAVRQKTCPPTAAEGPGAIPSLPGLAVMFSPADPRAKVVDNSADIFIQFAASPELSAVQGLCGTRSGVWTVSRTDVTTGKRYVTTGGAASAGGDKFRIETFNQEGWYKILYCPARAAAGCSNVGIIIENGKVWLGLTPQATPFLFEKKKAA